MSKSYGHRIQYIMPGVYRLSWTYDVKYPSSRLRFPRTITRDVERASAERFAKKWGREMPQDGWPYPQPIPSQGT